MNHTVSIVLAGLFAAPAFAQEPTGKAEETPPQKPVKTATEAAATNVRRPLAIGTRLDGMVALPDIDGKVHRASDYRGSVTVVNFWSTECPVMQGYEVTMSSIQTEFGKKGVKFLMVNANEGNREIADKVPASENAKPYQRIRDYLDKKKLERTVLVDHGSAIADKLGAKTTPDVFVFDATGKLVYRGLIDDDPNGKKGEKATHHLRDALEATLAGKPVAVTETKPFGCSIKRAKTQPQQRATAKPPKANKASDGESRKQ